MIFLDHGNISRHQCHDIEMHSFPDIDEIRFFDNGGPNLHTHNYIRIHKTTFFDHENICVDTIFKMI